MYDLAINNYADKLYYSAAISIDNFSSRADREILEKFGKATILTEILGNEQKASTKTKNELFKFRENWLRELFARFFRDHKTVKELKDDLTNNTLEFIIFNYDRCIEHFLFTAIKNYYSIRNAEEVYEILNCIRFHHIYGSISKMEWEIDKETKDLEEKGLPDNRLKAHKTFVEFGKHLKYDDDTPYYETIVSLLPNIKVIGEETAETDYGKLIKDADIVCILGYGFLRENNELLKLSDIKKASRTKGKFHISTYKLNKYKIKYINDVFGVAGESHDDNIYDFMRHNIF